MKQPLVSVMMPVYNGIGSIESSIKSLTLQTYQNWECIIINDGSTDDTRNFLDSLLDERFIVYHFDVNKGRPFARQKALDLASGKYLAMLDADDWYFPNKLEFQVAKLESNQDISLLSGSFMLTNKNGKLVCITGVAIETIGRGMSSKITHASSMLLTKYAKQVKYDLNLLQGEDLDFFKRVLRDDRYFMAVPECHYIYNVGESFSLKKYIDAQIVSMKYQNSYFMPFVKILVISLLYIFSFRDFIIRIRGRKFTNKENIDYLRVKKIILGKD